jgi:hypothetical protein
MSEQKIIHLFGTFERERNTKTFYVNFIVRSNSAIKYISYLTSDITIVIITIDSHF